MVPKVTKHIFKYWMDGTGLSDLVNRGYEVFGTLFETTKYIFRLDPEGVTAIILKNTLDWREPIIISWYLLKDTGSCLNLLGVEGFQEFSNLLTDIKRELTAKFDDENISIS